MICHFQKISIWNLVISPFKWFSLNKKSCQLIKYKLYPLLAWKAYYFGIFGLETNITYRICKVNVTFSILNCNHKRIQNYQLSNSFQNVALISLRNSLEFHYLLNISNSLSIVIYEYNLILSIYSKLIYTLINLRLMEFHNPSITSHNEQIKSTEAMPLARPKRAAAD